MIKVPDFAEWSSLYSELECRNECLSNCSCIAYSYFKGIGCMLWTRSLIDIQKFSYGGADLYLRLAYSELDKRKSMKIVIRITVIFGTIAFSICAFLSWRCMVKHGERKRKSKRNSGGKVKLQELPAVFSLHSREQFILLKIKKITIRIYMEERIIFTQLNSHYPLLHKATGLLLLTALFSFSLLTYFSQFRLSMVPLFIGFNGRCSCSFVNNDGYSLSIVGVTSLTISSCHQ